MREIVRNENGVASHRSRRRNATTQYNKFSPAISPGTSGAVSSVASLNNGAPKFSRQPRAKCRKREMTMPEAKRGSGMNKIIVIHI